MTAAQQTLELSLGEMPQALSRATGSAGVKLDADTYRHRYGSKGWRDAEARRITREDAAQRGWRRELYDRRFLRWVKPFIERGELPPRSEWPVPFRQRNGIPF